MAQHDYSIANQGFPATRADINNVLSAIATNNSGTSAPSTQYAGQFWIDTTSSTWTLYIHDGADDIQFATIDTSANTVNFIDSELADGSVTNAKLGADAVDGDKIADDSIDSEHYVDGSIDTAHIADSQITTAKINDDAVTTAKINDNAVTNAKLSFNANQYRNIIINGDMSIAQRGTSVNVGNNDSGYHTVDRWRFQESGSPTAVFTMSQDTDVPTGQGFAKSLKMDCATAQGSLAASDLIRIEQRFEGQNLQYLKKGTSSAESLTMSFWVKSNKTGTYIAELNDSDNGRQISKSYTIDSASTWEKKTLTFEGDTTGALDNDNALSLVARWWLVAGTDFTSGTLATSWQANNNADRAVGQVNLADSTSNDWYITGIQLEAGTTASDFEFLPTDVNLQRCYRYCYRINGNATDEQLTSTGGVIFSTSVSSINYTFHPPLRAVPTVSESNSTEQVTNAAMSLSSLYDDNQVGICNSVGVAFSADSGTPFTANNYSNMRLQNTTAAFIEFDSEL